MYSASPAVPKKGHEDTDRGASRPEEALCWIFCNGNRAPGRSSVSRCRERITGCPRPSSTGRSPAERLAWFITSEFYPHIDHYIDLHGGASLETLHPQVYYCGVTDEAVAREARRMALATGFACLIRLTSHNLVTTCSYGGSQGIPCILMELGCAGVWSVEQREDYIRRVRSVLNAIGVISAPDLSGTCEPIELLDVSCAPSALDGCWLPCLAAGDTFRAGDLLGTVTDYFGVEKQRIVAEEDGIILYQRCSLGIPRGASPIVYGRRVG